MEFPFDCYNHFCFDRTEMTLHRGRFPVPITVRLIVLLFAAFAVAGVRAQEAADDPETEAIALFNKGQDAHEVGDLRAAISLYEKALKLIPNFPEAELQRGSAYQSLGELDTAEGSFRRALSLRQDWSLALAHLGSLLIRREKFEEAGPLLKRAIEVNPENTPAYAAMATLAVRTNAPASELNALLKKISSMAAAAKTTAATWSAKAILENALGEKKAAFASAARSLELDPKNISMLALSASIAIDHSDPDRAAAYIEKIAAVDAAAVELPFLKTRLFLERGNNDEALKYAASIANPTKDLIVLKAQIVAATSTDTAALEKQLEAEPRNITALSRLCSLHRVGQPLKAMEFCRRALEVEPNNIEHAVGYGAAMLQAKDYQNAAALFQKLLASAPENFTLRANLATALFQLKRYNEAKVQFQWLVEKQPENVAAYFFLAVSHDQLAEYADAAANYQIFLRMADPKTNQLEIEKINLRLPVLQKQLDAGKGRKNVKTKS